MGQAVTKVQEDRGDLYLPPQSTPNTDKQNVTTSGNNEVWGGIPPLIKGFL